MPKNHSEEDEQIAPGTRKKQIEFSERTEHIEMSDGKQITGTPRYASLNSHMGLEMSRRDDLEQILYLLVYLFHGRLPWSHLYFS